MKLSIKDGLITLFTNGPINWIKWGGVFAILIGGYIFTVPLFSKISYRLSWERKRDIAKSRNHVIKADLVKKFPSGEVGRYDWHATYRYEFEGAVQQYHALFINPQVPPRCLHLYYLENPHKLFSFDEYHYENHKAIILLPVYFLPWILAAAAIVLLKIELPTM